MDWQQTVSLAIVGLVVALFSWAHWRPRKFDFKRDTHCGCSSSGTPEKNSIVFHVRKGGRPEVIVKMK